MKVRTESGIWAKADAQIFRLMMAEGKADRKALVTDRMITNAARQVASLRQRSSAKAARDFRQAERVVDAEMRQRSWGKPLHVKAQKSRPQIAHKPSRVKISKGAAPQKRAFRAYAAPLKDARGRVAIIFMTTYAGFRSKNWRSGLSVDHARYILRADALEQPDAPILSNMGETPDEVADCWRVLEEVEKAYRANAKVQMRIIWNLPHQLSGDDRREMVNSFCDREFGRLGLPYVAAIHVPDRDGDQRNYHAHICFSTRPVERVGENEWVMAQEKVNGLDDAAGLRRLRAMAAAHMNLACRRVGLPNLYTHQSYRERGLNAVRQNHVGPARTAAYRAGEEVDVVKQNANRVDHNEASVSLQKADAYSNRLNVIADRLEQSQAAGEINERRQQALRVIQARLSAPRESDEMPSDRASADRTAVLQKVLTASRSMPNSAARLMIDHSAYRTLLLGKLFKRLTVAPKLRPLSEHRPQLIAALHSVADVLVSTSRRTPCVPALTDRLNELQLSAAQSARAQNLFATAKQRKQEHTRAIELMMKSSNCTGNEASEAKQAGLAQQSEIARAASDLVHAQIDEAALSSWRKARRERRIYDQQLLAYNLLRRLSIDPALKSTTPDIDLLLADARAWRERLVQLHKARTNRQV